MLQKQWGIVDSTSQRTGLKGVDAVWVCKFSTPSDIDAIDSLGHKVVARGFKSKKEAMKMLKLFKE